MLCLHFEAIVIKSHKSHFDVIYEHPMLGFALAAPDCGCIRTYKHS